METITTRTLVEYFVHGETPLQEGFLAQFFTGVNKDKLADLKQEMADGFKTEADKQKALEAIDDLIDDSNRVLTPANLKSVLMGVLPFATVAYVVTRIISHVDGEPKKFREALHDLRTLVKSAKVKG
jgi:hypothetical protein